MLSPIWKLNGNSIIWNVTPGQVHQDDFEMAGLFADFTVYYGVKEDGTLSLSHRSLFPTLRNIPNDTHASFNFTVSDNDRPFLIYQNERVAESPVSFTLDGTLTVVSKTNSGLTVERKFYPASNSLFCVEQVTLRSNFPLSLTLSRPNESVHCYGRGTKGVYVCRISHTAPAEINLTPENKVVFYQYYSASLSNAPFTLPDGKAELDARYDRIAKLCDSALVLKTEVPELDAMTRFTKLRAGESIFETLTGKYHSPGGGSYFGATWCNDQIEYAGPHLAMTADKIAIEASINAYRSYIPFMSETYHRIPSSIISEGLDIWEGAGDRGDAAMYLYGASLFCLYLGDRSVAEKLWNAIKWCAEYCERRRSPEGVICSESDELEGRFPTDRYANLSTSCLTYGGLIYAAKLADALGDTDTAKEYRVRAAALATAIENYFGAELHEFKTYRYSRGFDTLRAWICLPLCMGINDRIEGTIDAMLSQYLWTTEGMLSCEISSENTTNTIWDRATLYGMKGIFLAGAGNRIVDPLVTYCTKRLLCDRVPYSVEAYPEGSKRHLAGESALFVRVITEGLFGISPESLNSFSFVPQVYSQIGDMELKFVHICSSCFDIKVTKESWTVSSQGKIIASGKTDGNRVVISL